RLSAMPESERRTFVPPGMTALLHMFPQLAAGIDAATLDTDAVPLSPQEQRQTAFVAFKELLRRLSSRAPLVVIVDDLQWADLDSARLLLELLGPPNRPALLYLGCYREEDEARSEFLREVRANATTERSGTQLRF